MQDVSGETTSPINTQSVCARIVWLDISQSGAIKVPDAIEGKYIGSDSDVTGPAECCLRPVNLSDRAAKRQSSRRQSGTRP